MPRKNPKNKQDSTFYLVKRLFNEHIKQHSRKIYLSVFCMVLVAGTTAANAWLMKPVIDRIFVEKDMRMLIIIPLAVVGLAVTKAFASYGQAVLMKYIGQRVITDMQLHLYEHLLESDVSLFQKHSSGKLLSRFSNDIQVIRRSIANILTNTIKESFTMVFLIGVMLYQSVTLSLIAFAAFPIAILPMLRLSRRMRKVANNTQEELGDFTARLDDTFQGIRVVKAYGREEYEVGKAREFMNKIFNLYFKAAKIESASPPVMEMLSGFSVALVIWYGGSQVVHGHTTPGAFFSFITALLMAYKPSKSMSGLNSSIQEGLASVRRYFAVVDDKPKVVDRPGAVKFTPKSGEIIFDNIGFSYNDEREALKNLSLHVPSGKRVALVGESGSGKSTIMNLILRFYDANNGSITIDGIDIANLQIKSLREQIAFVNQETILFDDTVRANIAYGKPGATEEEIIAASYAAAAHDFIVELPSGYDTLIGQHGMRLSGGQRQRLTIARAMLKNAPILLLDEATSSLDPVSEHQIQLALERLMKGRTTVVIAHRLSTVVHADLIYVIGGGRVIESGTHKELLDKNGEYTRLFNRQFAKVA